MDLLDMTVFMKDGIISEAAFFEKTENFDWQQYRDKRVLVKGCGTTIIPPWAFMVVTAQLTPLVKSIRYGNEHSSVSIYSRLYKEVTHANG
jgi:hypothetical protein